MSRTKKSNAFFPANGRSKDCQARLASEAGSAALQEFPPPPPNKTKVPAGPFFCLIESEGLEAASGTARGEPDEKKQRFFQANGRSKDCQARLASRSRKRSAARIPAASTRQNKGPNGAFFLFDRK